MSQLPDSFSPSKVVDAPSRPLGSLRLSVTDRCNLRCQYCMPEEDYVWLPREDVLSFEEMGVHVFDFGQNFTGWTRLRVEGPMGTEVRLRHAELVHEDGTLNLGPNENAEATDVYILRGGGQEVYEPSLTYHGFRYVEVTGFPGEPGLDALDGRFVHSDVRRTGELRTSNGLIDAIHRNTVWGQLSNFMSIPTDCPQRDERHGWLGDAHLSAEEALYNFDMAAFYGKFLEDIRLAQKEDGSLPDVVPPYLPHGSEKIQSFDVNSSTAQM